MRLRKKVRRCISLKIIIFNALEEGAGDKSSPELWSQVRSLESDVKASQIDRLKLLFERYSEREWNWWPFDSPDSPAKPLVNGKIRIRWQCVSKQSPDIAVYTH